MKILLTGATGFLGSNILRTLIENNYEVVILKRSFSSLNNIEHLINRFVSYNVDEININEVFQTEKNIDTVIHCATNYGRNNESTSAVLQCNLVFPLEVLETSAKNRVKLFISTDTSLSKLDTVQGYMQNYILSKKQFLDWGRLYSVTNGFTFVNLVLEHMYGPGDDPSKFIAYLIHSFKQDVNEIDLTEGEQFRDFVYIDDVVNVYLTIIRKVDMLSGYSEYEVGSGSAVKIKELVELTKELIQSTTKLNFGKIKYRDNEVMFSEAEITSLNKLGWKPIYDLRSGLEKYIKGFK